MSDLEKSELLIMDIYEMIELMNLYITKSSEKVNSAVDYGTGELFTSTEVHTVTMIHLNPGITAKEIADRTARTRSAVSQIITKLTDKQLLKTEKNLDDSRKTLLYVTEKGEELSVLHMKYDIKRMGPRIEKLVEELGVDAVNNFLQVMSRMISLYDF